MRLCPQQQERSCRRHGFNTVSPGQRVSAISNDANTPSLSITKVSPTTGASASGLTSRGS